MPGESTPLIQTVRIGPARRRYPHQTRRRFCTIACTCLLVAGFVSFAINVLFLWPIEHRYGQHSHYALSGHGGKSLSHDQLRSILLETPSAEHMKEWSYYCSSGADLAGRNYSQADWTRHKWQSWGIKADIVSYDTFINYPVDHSLSLLHREDEAAAWKVKFEASLTEDILDEDPTSALEERIPTFHGYSATGNATASFVYVNYGTYQDYEDLLKAGIPLQGKIAIARYGDIFRGLKVKRAQDLGMVGVLIYSDPGDDGNMTTENGYEAYPKGPARNPSSVQRGSVQYLSVRPGDPSTPGYPSKPGAPRAPVHDAIPSIPSLPISYTDALPILRALNGHGPKAVDINKDWSKNLCLRHEGVEYNLGPSPDNVVINISNQQNYTITPLWNVIGIVNGTIPGEVLVGNHRDAWIAGGAGDPHSGSAVLNEVVRSVGKAVEGGWKPMRTIVFASWDGEEYGLIGSTEWVEEYLPWLSEASVAYLNVDVGAVGPSLDVSAAPLLHQVFRRVTHLVPFPKQAGHDENRTVADVWDGKITTMGSGSDFTAFQDFAGIPSIDFSFKNADDSPVYHYHSNYDSFHWMDKFGDPGFKIHVTAARLLGLMMGELSNSILISFSAVDYAEALTDYLDQVEDKLKGKEEVSLADDNGIALRGVVSAKEARASASALEASLKSVRASLAILREKAQDLDALAAWAEGRLEAGIPWWDIIGKIKLWLAIAQANKQYKYLERHFLFEGGLDGRSWFKHVVFAPGLWTGYSGAVYPGLMESIDARDYNNGLKWAGIIKGCIERAMSSLS